MTAHAPATTVQDRTATADAVQQEVDQLLARARILTAPPLRSAVGRLVPPTDMFAAYHFGWADAAGRPAASDTGKGLRAALVLLSGEAAGAPPSAWLPGAVAVELVHNFSLVHDDLMDGDEQHRHRDTVWKAYGPAQAVLVGDALLALADETLLDLGTEQAARAARLLATAVRRLIDGQTRDLAFERRRKVTLDEYLTMAGDKTGALLACACGVGAVLGGATDGEAEALARYGHHLGLAFQAVDDLLGIWGDPKVTGKPAWGDLRRHKMTLPLVAALDAGGPASDRLATRLAAHWDAAPGPVPGAAPAAADGARDEVAPCHEEERLAELAALIEEAGGRRRAHAEARRQRDAALAALDPLCLPDEVRRAFGRLAEFVSVRSK